MSHGLPRDPSNPSVDDAASFAATSPNCRIVKLGGSLFELPELSHALRKWQSSQAEANTVWIAGGGQWADAVRQWDTKHGLGESFCHDLCLRLMSVSARLAARLIQATWPDERIRVVSDWSELTSLVARPSRKVQVVFDIGAALLANPPATASAMEIPESWDVTSDSLAAYVTNRLISGGVPSCELVLLKSCDPPDPPTVAEAAKRGLVDAYFPVLSANITRIQFASLAASSTQILSPIPTDPGRWLAE